MVSYIVSAYDRPDSLPGCLWSLKIQTDQNFEVIVTDNGGTQRNQDAVAAMNDSRFRYVNTKVVATSPAWDCYWSAEYAVSNLTRGEWICLPSDDSYYVPIFQAAMLAAARAGNWNLVYCDMLYDRKITGRYEKLDVQPTVNHIDKTGFLLRRESWIGFPDKRTDSPGPCDCDGRTIDRLRQSGIRHGKVHETLCVHN